MKSCLCLISLCVVAGNCQAACFQNGCTGAQLYPAVRSAEADYAVLRAGCFVAGRGATLANPDAPAVVPCADGFGGYGFNNLFLRQRFVNGRQLQPLVVLKETQAKQIAAAKVLVVKVQAKRRGVRVGALGLTRNLAGQALGAVERFGNNVLDFLVLRELFRR